MIHYLFFYKADNFFLIFYFLLFSIATIVENHVLKLWYYSINTWLYDLQQIQNVLVTYLLSVTHICITFVIYLTSLWTKLFAVCKTALAICKLLAFYSTDQLSCSWMWGTSRSHRFTHHSTTVASVSQPQHYSSCSCQALSNSPKWYEKLESNLWRCCRKKRNSTAIF